MEPTKFLNSYSGQAVDALIALEKEYRIDSIVLAFEQAIGQKAEHNLTEPERIVLAVEALEREVNNGGYDQFFLNSSCQYTSTIVGALERIGCPKTAKITQTAIDTLGLSDLTVESIERTMQKDDEERRDKHSKCDEAYYNSGEDIANRLFQFIKKNKGLISFES